ncbi:hypothetical protein SLA2020_304040 [Shorea laevis]
MYKIILLVSLIAQLHNAIHGAVISCSQTPFPIVCESSMSKHLKGNVSQTEFHHIALKVTTDQTIHAHKLISNMDTSSLDDRAKLAWSDCVLFYEDTVRLLNLSMWSRNLEDVQTWLSAAVTNHETCQNGFMDFNMTDYLQRLPFKIESFSMLLRNSLAINKAAASGGFKDKPGRILSDGFPTWVSAADRKLLEETTNPLKVDAVVAQDGSGDFKTIMEAVAVVTSGNKTLNVTQGFVIYIKKGVYKENVEIKMSGESITFLGDGIDATVITSNKSFSQNLTTFRTATLGIRGAGLFMARNMTFENTAGPGRKQAVALRAASDFSVFYNCSFKGYQDTLYVYSQRQFYRNCDIYGTIDFIFGDASVVFQDCNIYVRRPMINQDNTITAQGRSEQNQTTGIVIHSSRVMAAPDLKPVQELFKTYLGRPWKIYSRTVIMKSELDDLVDPRGWKEWNETFGLSTLYYGEYMNTGVGANTSGRVKWPGYHVISSVAEATNFTVENFLQGRSWLPATQVPFKIDL